MRNKNILLILTFLILIISINTVSAEMQPVKAYGEAGGGLPNNPILDWIKNSLTSLKLLSFSISCPSGYSYCYENEYIYGDARADAKVFISAPYIETTESGQKLYINYKFDASKYYIYRGITDWSQVHCTSSGCDGQQVSSSGKYLLGASPSMTQPGIVFVGWDYNSYNGYWAWTWVGFGWMSPFTYFLSGEGQIPDATLTKLMISDRYSGKWLIGTFASPGYVRVYDNESLFWSGNIIVYPPDYNIAGKDIVQIPSSGWTEGTHDVCVKGTNTLCIPITITYPRCTDGSVAGTCLPNKPQYCDYTGMFVQRASICGCPTGQIPSGDNCITPKCSDGTLYNTCSITKPLYCDSMGVLINKTITCGCPSGFKPQNDECIIDCPSYAPPYCPLGTIVSQGLDERGCEKPPLCVNDKCSDNTPYGSCSIDKPLYCDNKGNLYSNASLCGCPPKTFKSGDICKPGSENPLFNLILIFIDWLRTLIWR